MFNIQKPRERSGLFGACGGLLGWTLSEFLWGTPTSFAGTVIVGALAGLGIGVMLGAAEGILSGSRQLLQRGVKAGLLAGLLGGAAGAMAGQFGFVVLSGRSIAAASGSASSQTVFSTDVTERLSAAGAKTGEIEISLIWENFNDLDLHVIDPSGFRIYFADRVSRTGGELDIDRNASCGSDITRKPIEHVVWTKDAVPKGVYQVGVHHYLNCGSDDPTVYRVEVKIGDEIVARHRGEITHVVSLSPVIPILEFSYPSTAAAALKGQEIPGHNQGSNLGAVIGRLLGWLVFGMLVGCAEGAKRQTRSATINAVLGGAIGGLMGGILFQLIASAGLPGTLSRLVGFAILGASIGILIAIVDQLRSSFLVVENGRYAGREIAVDKPIVRLGRNDVLEAYIGGDQAISPHHATIEQRPNGLLVTAVEGSLRVNGVEKSQGPLVDGDRLSIGNTIFAVRSRHRDNSLAAVSTPTPLTSQTTPTVKGAIPPPPPRSGRTTPASLPVDPNRSLKPPETVNPPMRPKLPPPPPRRQQ